MAMATHTLYDEKYSLNKVTQQQNENDNDFLARKTINDGKNEDSFINSLSNENVLKIIILSTIFPLHNLDIVNEKKRNRTGFLAYDIEYGIHENLTVGKMIQALPGHTLADLFNSNPLCMYTEDAGDYFGTFIGFIEEADKNFDTQATIQKIINGKQLSNEKLGVRTLYRFHAPKSEIIKKGIIRDKFKDRLYEARVPIEWHSPDFYLIPNLTVMEQQLIDGTATDPSSFHNITKFAELAKKKTQGDKMNWGEFNDNFTFYKNILQSLRKFGKSYDSVAKRQHTLTPILQSLNDGTTTSKGKINNHYCVLCRKEIGVNGDADHLLALAPQETFLINDQVLSYMYICADCNRHFKSNKTFCIDRNLWSKLHQKIGVNPNDQGFFYPKGEASIANLTFTAREAFAFGASPNNRTQGAQKQEITDLHINIFFCLRFIELYDIIISNRYDFEKIHDDLKVNTVDYNIITTAHITNASGTFRGIGYKLYTALVSTTKNLGSRLELLRALTGRTAAVRKQEEEKDKRDIVLYSQTTEAVKKLVKETVEAINLRPDDIIPGEDIQKQFNPETINDFLSWDIDRYIKGEINDAKKYHEASKQAAAQMLSSKIYISTMNLATASEYSILRNFLQDGVELKSLAISILFINERISKMERGARRIEVKRKIADAHGLLKARLHQLLEKRNEKLMGELDIPPSPRLPEDPNHSGGNSSTHGGRGKLIKYKKKQRKNKKTNKRRKKKRTRRKK